MEFILTDDDFRYLGPPPRIGNGPAMRERQRRRFHIADKHGITVAEVTKQYAALARQLREN